VTICHVHFSSIYISINFALMNLQVTWVEHVEYEENQVHQLYRPLLSSGVGFGAARWVATLQRQCECLAILMSSAAPSRDHSGTVLIHNNFATHKYINFLCMLSTKLEQIVFLQQ
jgi:hypothetical protein